MPRNLDDGSAEAIRLVDRQLIADLFVSYAAAVDARDWDTLKRCFTDDAYADYGIGGAHFGQAAIVEQCRLGVGHLAATHHMISNVLIDFDGADSARAQSYFHAKHVSTAALPGGSTFIVAGSYRDKLERQTDVNPDGVSGDLLI